MTPIAAQRAVHILLVEDNPGDVRLVQEVFNEATIPIRLHVARDGVDALAFLARRDGHEDVPRPDLVLLDLNLPRMDGRELLERMKSDESLRRIPVVVLTSSSAESDVRHAYDRHANCYLTKPVDFDCLVDTVRAVESFWLARARLPAS